MKMNSKTESGLQTAEFAARVHLDQQRIGADLKPRYDFIVCGSGSSGSVVARRLAENRKVSVLLLEAGGDDDVPSVMEASQWPTNLGSERDWSFYAQPNPALNGRSVLLSMGKALGGGSSINVMVWARGHKSDWDFFASEAGDPAWSYQSILNIYRRIEDWHGVPDPKYRGTGGPVFVEPAPDPNPIAPAMVEGTRSVGIPTFENQNGRMMEGEGGASIIDLRVRNGKRQSVFRSYTFPFMDRPNLTVLTHALVTRITFEGKRATGGEISYGGQTRSIRADLEVILSLGAIHTHRVLSNPVSAIKPNCSVLESRSGSIYRGSGRTSKTILPWGAFGSIRKRYRRATTWARRRFSGAANLVWRALTCRLARARFHCRVPRTQRDLGGGDRLRDRRAGEHDTGATAASAAIQAAPANRPQALRNASRSPLSWSLCVSVRPWGAPA